MSALLESLLDATRRAACAANDLEFGCSRSSSAAQDQMREEVSALAIPAAGDGGHVGTGVTNPDCVSLRPARAAGLDQT